MVWIRRISAVERLPSAIQSIGIIPNLLMDIWITFLSIRPDIVFLQEVVPVTHATIESKLSTNYDLISGAFYVDQPYYSMIMTHRARVRLQSQLVRPFATSQMGRCLIEAEVGSAPTLWYL
jgi:hypothetical protein